MNSCKNNICRNCISLQDRSLVVRPHKNNGVGNRLAGIRGAYALAKITNRTFFIDWPQNETESSFFNIKYNKNFNYSKYYDLNENNCPVVLIETFPSMSSTIIKWGYSDEKIIVLEQLYNDLGFEKDASLIYKQLFRPTKKFKHSLQNYVSSLGLHKSWIGFQVRRNDRNYNPLTQREVVDIDKSVRCIKNINKSHVFLTTNSLHVKEYLKNHKFIVNTDSSYSKHSNKKNGYKKSLLEFATLASSSMIVGTAGSTFAREASYFGGIELTMLIQQTFSVIKNKKAYGKCCFINRYAKNIFEL